MKNVKLEGKLLIIKGTAKGSIVSTFALFLIVFEYFFFISGIFLIFISLIIYVINAKKVYFEINENMIFFILLDHTKYDLNFHYRVLSIILNNEIEKSKWINGKYEEEVSKYEIDLDPFPTKKRASEVIGTSGRNIWHHVQRK